MATRLLSGDQILKDSGLICSDASIAFYLAGSSTPQEVFSDHGLTVSLGTSVSCGSLGIVPDIFCSDSISIKAVISGTGVAPRTLDYLTIADTTTAGVTSSALSLTNAIVNGAFSDWTANTSFSNISGTGTGVVTADNWFFTQPAAASNAISRQTAVGASARYCYRVGRPAASTSTNKLRVWSLIPVDDVYRLRGQAITLSVSLRAGANFTGTGIQVRVATGTAEGESGDLIDSGGFTGNFNSIDQAQSITTTQTRFEFHATLNANIKEIGLQLSYTGAGTAGAADYFEIEDVQFEISAAATSFKSAPEPVDFLRANLTTTGKALISAASAAAAATALNAVTTGSAASLASVTASQGAANTTPSARFVNTTDNATNLAASFESQRATQAANDAVYVEYKLKNAAGAQTAFGQLKFKGNPITAGSEAGFFVVALANGAGSVADALVVGSTVVRPSTNDALALGSATLSFSDLFIASGGVINFNNSDWVGTHSTGVFTVGTGDLRVTNAGSDPASVVTVGGTQTLTNKTLTSPTINGGTSSSRIQLSSETTGTLTVASANKKILASGGITLPNAVFSAQDATIIAGNGTARTITRGASIQMFVNNVDSATATLTANGVMGVHWRTASICELTGNVS